MKHKPFIEAKTKGNNDCYECYFANTCTNNCRIKNGYHWEEQ